MHIIVLMKQVPDTEAPVEIAATRDRLDTEDLKWAINPYDEYALEEALLIKESGEDVTVTVLTIGPDRVAEAIRVAYAMGADNAVHINDECGPGIHGAADPYTTALILARFLEKTPCDLIIAGNRSVDYDNYQVPAFLSRMLGIPLISRVVNQEISSGAITCEQTIDGGTAVVKTALPALITAQKGLNEPRYPAFRAIMKAKKKKVDLKTLEELGLTPEDAGTGQAKVTVRSMDYPPERSSGKVIEGANPAEKAAALVKLLKEEACVI